MVICWCLSGGGDCYKWILAPLNGTVYTMKHVVAVKFEVGSRCVAAWCSWVAGPGLGGVFAPLGELVLQQQ
jgi:hypothetical protein